MKYHVTIGERTFVVDLTGGCVEIDGTAVEAHLERVGDGPLRSLVMDDRSHRIVAHRSRAEVWEVHLDGLRLRAQAVDERMSAIREMTARAGGAAGPKPLLAPMPGMVVKVSVAVGDRVSAGQGIAIVEAMKMENELKAATDGIVTRVAAAEGEAVEKDQLLVDLGPLPEEEGAGEGSE